MIVKFLIACLAAMFVVSAAAPQDVATDVVSNGFVVESGSDATDAVVGRAVSDARAAGSLFYVVVLAEEPGAGATTFADGILDLVPRSDGTVLVVAPDTVGWASDSDIWSTSQLDDALDASLEGGSSDEVVSIFVAELVDVPPGAGGVSGWLIAAIVLIVGVAVLVLIVRSSRKSRETRQRSMADLRSKAQAQIDDIANDILDLEDEVAESGNAEARQHFDAATDVYASAAERLTDAKDAIAIVSVSEELDRGIWHLDCAEAILDGNPLPPEPVPPAPVPPVPASPPGTAPPIPGSGSAVPTLPEYQRRTTRRSGFGADDMLRTVIAMQAMRGLGGFGGRSVGSSRSHSGGGARRTSSPKGRSRGGGRRRG